MRVKVNRQAHFVAQGREKPRGRIRFAQSAHVLDAQNVRAHLFQFFGQANVILQRIFIALRIEDVAGVADGRLAHFVRFIANRLDRKLHVGQPVQRVENAKNIDALFRGLQNEGLDRVVRIRRIPYAVGRAKQHLETNIGDGLPQKLEPRPGIFEKKSHGHVERRAAPHFHAVKVVQLVRDKIGNGQQIIGANARGHERLVRVAERRVRDQKLLLRFRPLREFFGAELVEKLARARRRLARNVRGKRSGANRSAAWVYPQPRDFRSR